MVFGSDNCAGAQAAEDRTLEVWSHHRPDWGPEELRGALSGLRLEIVDGLVDPDLGVDGRYTRSLHRIQLTRFPTWHEAPYVHETAHMFGHLLDGNSRNDHEGWWDAGFWPAELEGTRVSEPM